MPDRGEYIATAAPRQGKGRKRGKEQGRKGGREEGKKGGREEGKGGEGNKGGREGEEGNKGGREGGRKGSDFSHRTHAHQVVDLLSGPYDRCSSSLLMGGAPVLLSLVLTLIGLKVVATSLLA